MGYRLIKHLESAGYNRKLFYLDRGAQDLPPIVNKTDIQPGSEARNLLTGEKWILNTAYEWIYVGNDDTLLPVDINDPKPTVKSISIVPSAITTKPGSTIQLFAVVDAEEEISREVKWSVSPNPTSKKTTIDYKGLFTIDESEKQRDFTIKATSLADEKVVAKVTVKIPYTEKEQEQLPDYELTSFALEPRTAIVVADWHERGADPLSTVFGFNISGIGVNITDLNAFEVEISGNTDPNTTVKKVLIGGFPKVIFTPGDHEHARAIKVTAYVTVDSKRYVAHAMVHVEPRHTSKAIPWITKFDWAPAIADRIKVEDGIDTITIPFNSGDDPFVQLAYIIEGVNDFDRTVRFDLVSDGGDKNAYIDLQNRLHFSTNALYKVKAYPFGNINLAKELQIRTGGNQNTAVTVPKMKISPAAISLHQGERYTFTASAFGTEKHKIDLDHIVWVVDNNTSKETTVTDQGILTVGVGETSDAIFVGAYSATDPALRDTVVVEILPVATKAEAGIEEIPVWPEHKEYIRHMNHNGIAEWRPTHFVPVEDFDARRDENYSKLIDKITVDKDDNLVTFTIFDYDVMPRKHDNHPLNFPVSQPYQSGLNRGIAGSMSGRQAEELYHLTNLVNTGNYIKVGVPNGNNVVSDKYDKIQLKFVDTTDNYGKVYKTAVLSIADYAKEIYARFEKDELEYLRRDELAINGNDDANIVRYMTNVTTVSNATEVTMSIYGFNPVERKPQNNTINLPMATTSKSGCVTAAQVQDLETVVAQAFRGFSKATTGTQITITATGSNLIESTKSFILPTVSESSAGLMSADLFKQFKTAQSDISTLQTQMSTLINTTIPNLRTDFTNADTAIRKDLTTLQTNINDKFTTIQNQIVSKLDSGIKTMNDNLATMTQSIQDLDGSFTNYKSYVATTYAVADGNATQGWVNEQLKNYQAKGSYAASSTVTTLSNTVNGHTTSISNINSSISTINSNITSIKNALRNAGISV